MHLLIERFDLMLLLFLMLMINVPDAPPAKFPVTFAPPAPDPITNEPDTAFAAPVSDAVLNPPVPKSILIPPAALLASKLIALASATPEFNVIPPTSEVN